MQPEKTNFIKILFQKVLESARNKNNRLSSSRLSSYFILGGILTASAAFVSIEIVNAIIVWVRGETYVIPTAHIMIFDSILIHHLVLLGLKNAGERGQPTIKKPTEETPTE